MSLDYVRRKACGCYVSWIAPEYFTAKELAREIAGWIKDGLSVERMSTEESREKLGTCRCNAKPPPPPESSQESLSLGTGSPTSEREVRALSREGTPTAQEDAK